MPGRLLALAASTAALALVAGCGGGGKPRPDLVFVSSRDGVYALYAMNADGSRQTRFSSAELPSSATPKQLFFETDPAWSPDGRRVAFASNRSGQFQIYVAAADGSGARPVTSLAGGATEPAWSPDGRWIVFVRFQPGGLYLVPAAGGAPRRLGIYDASESSPTWSRTGWIAYARRAPATTTSEIWIERPDGSGRRQVTRLNAGAASPSWSPNGRRIAFVDDKRGQYEVYVVDRDGANLRRLTSTTSDDVQPAWSPDAKLIAFSRDGAVATVDLGGRVSTLTSSKNNDSNPAWNPIPALSGK